MGSCFSKSEEQVTESVPAAAQAAITEKDAEMARLEQEAAKQENDVADAKITGGQVYNTAIVGTALNPDNLDDPPAASAAQ